jgi:hypothetical protein
MASVSSEQWLRADTDRKVLDPLQSVRKYIRSYVVFETGAIVVILLCTWFWVGLLLDYLPFAFFSFDWLQSLNQVDASHNASRWIRGIILFVVVAWVGYYLVSRLFLRFFTEFSDQSIALVLEKRFPHILEERLISAIQLSDPKIAEQYNFSPVMVQRTIEEARERVQHVPVEQVFDWSRLRWLWVWALVVTFGVFLLVGGLAIGYRSLRERPMGPVRYAWNFYHTAAIFTERNLLMGSSYYPRDAHLEVVRFQDHGHKGEMKIPAEENRPDLVIRAVEWAIADPESMGGWRSIKIAEAAPLVPGFESALAELPFSPTFPYWIFDGDDVDESIPSGVVPDIWTGKTHEEVSTLLESEQKLTPDIKKSLRETMNYQNWTVDKLFVQWKLVVEAERFKKSNPAQFAKAAEAMDRLAERLHDAEEGGRQQRRFRRMQVPTDVAAVFYYVDRNSVNPGEGKPGQNKYIVELKNLEESADMVVRGGDYTTPPLKLTLVGPPRVVSLHMEKREPAYLYQRVVGSQAKLKGERQVFRNIDVSHLKEIPIAQGGDITLLGTFEPGRKIRPKGFTMFALPEAPAPVVPLAENERRERWEMPRARVVIEPQGGAPIRGDALILAQDRGSFRFQMRNVQSLVGFTIEFFDEDNVRGQATLKIRTVPDTPPQFDTANEFVKNIDLAVGLRKPKIKGEQGKEQQTFGDGLLITPDAAIPFNCNKLADKQGLADVRWIFEVEPVRFELTGRAEDVKARATRFLLRGEEGTRRAALAVSTLQFGPGSGMGNLYNPFYMHLAGQIMTSDLERKDNFSVERSKPLDAFYDRLAAVPELPLAQLPSALEMPVPEKLPHLTTFVMNGDVFDVRKHIPELKVKDAKVEAQLHYQVKVTMELVDTNIETGPGVARPKSVYTFLVVSDTELLAQIGQEEEDLRTLLDEQYKKLSIAKTKVQDTISKLASPDPDYGFIAIRSGEVRKQLLSSGEETRKATNAYTRILEEMRVNRLSDERIRTLDRKIVRPLQTLVKTELAAHEKIDTSIGNFGLADDAATAFHEPIDKEVEERTDDRNRDQHLQRARALLLQLDRVMNQLNNVLSAMDDGIDFARSLDQALQIERGTRQNYQMLADLHRRIADSFFDDILNPKK